MALKVWVDQDECGGKGKCAKAVPEVFKLVKGKAFVTENGKVVGEGGPDALALVPEALEDKVIAAADKCPNSCIFVEVE